MNKKIIAIAAVIVVIVFGVSIWMLDSSSLDDFN